MIRSLITLFAIATLTMGQLAAQGKLLKKAMSKYADATGNSTGGMEFYADEDLTQPITSVADGEFNFYVKATLNKNAARLCDNYSRAILDLRFDDSRNIYGDEIETGKPLIKTADDPGFLVYKIEMLDQDKGDLVNEYISDATEKRIYPLGFKVFCPGKNKTVSEGEFKMDLTMGNDKYMEAFLDRYADYSFDHTDDFKDDALKAVVKNHWKTLKGIEIVNFAWGERVPYRSDDGQYNIRRHSAVVTYVDSDDNKCYKSGLSVFDDAPWPSTDYKFDGGSTSLNNSVQIPCSNIGR